MALGGIFVLTAAAYWTLFRLGGFTVTAREKRVYPLFAALAVAWIGVLAIAGPLPLPIVIGMNVATWALFIWAWRSGKFAIERVPDEMRPEVEHRRRWMREHRLLMVALFAAYMVLSLAWGLVIVVIALSQRG